MNWVRIVAVIAVCAGLAGPSLAQDSPALRPSSPWTLDYDADSCALRRLFGEGEERAYLEIRRFDRGLGLQTVIATNWMTARNRRTFRYRFNTDTEWREAEGAFALRMADGFSGVLFTPALVELPELEEMKDPLERARYLATLDLPALEDEAARPTDAITLIGAFRREITLELGAFGPPLKALRDCVEELRTHWDIDVEAHETLTRKAEPVNLEEVPRMMSYPPKMLREGLQGVVNVRLDVDPTGRITECHIQMPLSDPEFEESSCADIQHALDFDPALDKDGNPIPSYWTTRVVFQLGR